ncbi:MAG: FtsX-like permease family protein [Bryobacteraceae bacterium]|jgi:putative ABC transport system permease protein
MKILLLLAFRNIFRNRRRTLMTLLVVVGGVSALLLAGGFFSCLFWRLREGTISAGLGHIQIYNSDYFKRDETRALENGLENYRDLTTIAANTPHVRGIAPRIEFFGMVSNGMKSGTFMAAAVDPAAETRMGFEPRILQGRNLQEHPGAGYEVLLGTGLARSMGATPGTGLTLLAITADGALNGIDVDVAGIMTTGFKEVDDRTLRLTLPAAQHLLQSGRVTKLIVGLDSTESTDAAYTALQSRLGQRAPVTLKKWLELATYYRQVRLMFSGMLVFLGIIVFFMVVMSSANTLMMAMFERTREVGTMLAMGTPRRWVMTLFLMEGVLTGALGAVVGVLAGSGIAELVNRANLQMPAPPGTLNGFPFHVFHVPELMYGAALLVVVTLAAASLAPAIRASRLRIVEALAHV